MKRPSKRNNSVLGFIAALFAALRDRWAERLTEDVRSENERQLRLHRQYEEEQAGGPQES